jgi:hypothetical protein
MIRGKYLRERKAIRVKRRFKILLSITILLILYKIIFSSFSLYESEAISATDLDIAFYALEDSYQTNVISLEDMLPGETKTYYFSIANFKDNEDGTTDVAETDIEYTLTIRTTTNLYFEYELYVDQDPDDASSESICLSSPILYKDDYDTYFKKIVEYKETFVQAAGANTDNYTLKITLPAEYDSVAYQNIIDCIEITIESHQILSTETTVDS